MNTGINMRDPCTEDEEILNGLILKSGIIPSGLNISDYQGERNKKIFKTILKVAETITPDIVKVVAEFRNEEDIDNSFISYVIRLTDTGIVANKTQIEYYKNRVIENSRTRQLHELAEKFKNKELSHDEYLVKVNKLSVLREKKQPTTIIKTFSDITPQKISWLWPDKIALGKLAIFAGNPGSGKSQCTLYMASIASTGGTFPDGSRCPQGDTIILTTEDDDSDTIRPRLDVVGADTSRVHIIKGVQNTDGKIKPVTLKMIDAFYDAVCQIRNKNHNFILLIIDPLDGLLDGGDSNSNEEVRAALDGICSLAEKEKFAIIGIKHLNKNKGDIAYRVGGSMAWTAKARSVWIFAEDKETDRKMFLPLKNNLGIDKGGFYYSIQQKDIGGIIAPYFNWEGVANDDLQEVLNSYVDRGKPKAALQEDIINVLKEAGRAMRTSEIAIALDKSEQTVSNALYKLKAKGDIENPSYGHWQLTSNLHLHHQKEGVSSDVSSDFSQVTSAYNRENVSVSVSSDESTKKQPVLDLQPGNDIEIAVFDFIRENQNVDIALLTESVNEEKSGDILRALNKLKSDNWVYKNESGYYKIKQPEGVGV